MSYSANLKGKTSSLPCARTFRLAGLVIESEFPLAGLIPSAGPDAPAADVVIRRGRVPETLAAPRPGGNDLQFDGNDVLLNIPSAGRFLVRGGREIVIDQFASAGDDDVRAFLLGKVFGVLCHRRDITPFHACVVDLGGECAAFAGPSRAGKSTLAAALAKRGYQVIADDACFTRADADGAIMVWPGIRRIRLWQEAVEIGRAHV
mgnify:CR=1 FL=1